MGIALSTDLVQVCFLFVFVCFFVVFFYLYREQI